ncbi:MAG TPA: PAS domain S-box protein [Desulfomonilia bacterium]|nr:PAS domain S-box protein [Desulfomonilia bacterium]
MGTNPTKENLDQRIHDHELEPLPNRAHETTRGVMLQNEERYRDILDSIEEAYFEVDLKGNLTFFNFTAVKRLGYSNEEMLGMSFHQFVDNENAMKVFDAFHKVFLTGETIKAFEWEFINKHGEKIAVESSVSLRRDENGSPIGFRGVVHDITERIFAEESLRRSEEKHRSIIENIEEGYYEVDLKGNFTFFNDPLCRMLGRDQQETMGMNYGQFIDEECKPKVYDIFHNVYLTGKPDKGFDWELVGKDGSRRSIESSVALIRDAQGKPVGFRGIVHDITEKKNIEQQLIRAQKMESIGTLAGGIAHDFNNLLMGILGNVSLALMNLDESHPIFTRLKSMEEYIQRGSDLTKQLLGFARGGKYEVKPTDLGEFVRRSSELFGRTKKEICIHLKDQKGLWTVEIDRGQMDQVFLNLFVNAWQAMPGGGDMYISVENVELDEMYVRPYEVKPGKFVKVTITDMGIGMDEATKARVFEPFFTTKERGRGTGLGLASVYGIIKNHGGFIYVESEQDIGTSFMIHLPASGKHVMEEYSEGDKEQRGHETVLLIDDEEMILDVGTELLEVLDYKVMKATGGMQGLQIFEQNKEAVDLVILDMIMPGFSGKETFDSLKRIDPCVKVLLSSGYSLDGQAEEIMQNGCNGFIQKPFSLGELAKKIRGILDE